MKKSNLFLTASLVAMTLAAVASTAGMKKTVTSYFYLKGSACVPVSQSIACSPATIESCLYLDPATGVNYNAYSNAFCNAPLGKD